MNNIQFQYQLKTRPYAIEIISVILSIIFIFFKLFHVIDWEWVFVLIPIWAGYMLDVIWGIIIKIFIVLCNYLYNHENDDK